jgi:MFS superfamily sulfate permease-like transporter
MNFARPLYNIKARGKNGGEMSSISKYTKIHIVLFPILMILFVFLVWKIYQALLENFFTGAILIVTLVILIIMTTIVAYKSSLDSKIEMKQIDEVGKELDWMIAHAEEE